MLYLEYDWMVGVYKPRVGGSFTDIRGVRSYESTKEAREHLESFGLTLGRKTDSRTWEIIELVPNVNGGTR